MNVRIWIVIAGVMGALGVGLGSFGAHALPLWLENSNVAAEDAARRIDVFEIGVRYQMYHALALLGVGLLAPKIKGRGPFFAGTALLLGTILFSGLLYALAITGIKILGAMVPVGGVLLIFGWAILAWAATSIDR